MAAVSKFMWGCGEGFIMLGIEILEAYAACSDRARFPLPDVTSRALPSLWAASRCQCVCWFVGVLVLVCVRACVWGRGLIKHSASMSSQKKVRGLMKEGPLVQMLDRQRVQQAAADEAKKLVDAAALAFERLVDATKEAEETATAAAAAAAAAALSAPANSMLVGRQVVRGWTFGR